MSYLLPDMRASINYLSWLADRFAENPYDEDTVDNIMSMLYDSFSIEKYHIIPPLVAIIRDSLYNGPLCRELRESLSDDDLQMIIAALSKILDVARNPRLEGWFTDTDFIGSVDHCLSIVLEIQRQRSGPPPPLQWDQWTTG